jgi:copper transport protein
MRKLVLLLFVLAGAGFVLAAPASAHATLTSSSPADGSRLRTAPASVTLHFDENVGITYVHVTEQSGRRVESGTATHPGGAGAVARVALKPGLHDASYTVSYRMVSADSHPIGGVITFVVGNGALVTRPQSTSVTPWGVSTSLDVARWVSTLGFTALAGVWLVFAAWPAGRGERRVRRIVWTGWAAALFGSIAEVLLQGVNAAGAPITSAFKWSLIHATIQTNFGGWHLLRIGLLVLTAIVLALALRRGRDRVWSEDALAPLGVVIAETFAIVGHARTTSPVWLSVGSDTLHLAAIGVWLGGLAILAIAVLPRRDADELAEVMPVFSRVAFGSVIVIAATGVYAAYRGTGSWRALFETEYGLLIIAKVVGFVGLLTLGNLSRVLIRRRLGGGRVVAYAMTADTEVEAPPSGFSATDVERMRRSVVVEVAIGVVVLALAAVLVGQPRGSDAIAADDRAPVSASAPLSTQRTVTMTVDPGRHGVVAVRLDLGPGAQPEHVDATATQPQAQLGPIPLHLVPAGPSYYTAAGLNLPVSGTWVITVDVMFSEFDAITTEMKVTLS